MLKQLTFQNSNRIPLKLEKRDEMLESALDSESEESGFSPRSATDHTALDNHQLPQSRFFICEMRIMILSEPTPSLSGSCQRL